jgi:release factor glutamine methyltransferase
MRIASNQLGDIVEFYHSELKDHYDKKEIAAMIDLSIGHYLGFSKQDVITKSRNNINQSDLIKLYDCCKSLKKHIPIQYIFCETWFYNLKLKVNKQVLIPRPETEELVEIILSENKTTRSYLDIGTGSGCIAIALKNNAPLCKVTANDISAEAIQVAQENANLHHAEITFFKSDVLDLNSFIDDTEDCFDVIVSNPPYIQQEEGDSMERHVIDHEPHLALFVKGRDAIIFYKKIIDLCQDKLYKQGRLYFELNPLTALAVKEYAHLSGIFEEVTLLKDMSGHTRFLRAIKF